jgi:PKD repeat protein
MEGMPGSNICNSNGGSDGTVYVAHHNPFVYFGNIVNNSTRCSSVVPSGSSNGATSCGTAVTTSAISSLVSDLNGNSPNFSWLTPNRNDDSHDCSMQQANSWLSVVVPAILTTKTFETDASATVVITFDEPTTGIYGTTPVYFMMAGPGAKPHYTSSTKFTHLNWLATIESNWSLGCLLSVQDCGASLMSEFFAHQYGEFQASFTYSPSNPQPNQTITFTASVSGGAPPYSYTWNFGDGSNGTGQMVSHSYLKAGTFTASLTVTDPTTHVITASKVLAIAAPTGFCLPCVLDTLSSSPQLLIGVGAGLALIASAVRLATRSSHRTNAGESKQPQSSEHS